VPILEQAATTLARGRAVVLAGPWLMAAAGLAPPESHGGLWDRWGVTRCATAAALDDSPEIAWQAFAEYRAAVLEVTARPEGPSPAHRALATLASLELLRGVITTTTDGLIRAAGVERVAELFGAIDRLRCRGCRHITEHRAHVVVAPRCALCGEALRPDMVLFGEPMPRAPRELAANWVYGGRSLLILGADIGRPPLRPIPLEMRQEGGQVIALGEVDREALAAVGGLHVEGALNVVLPAMVELLRLG